MSYLRDHTGSTPQSQPLTAEQTLNEAGGYTYPVEKWTTLRRFLILGTEAGSYYAGERELTKNARTIVGGCFDEDPKRTVETIVLVSGEGLSPRNDMAIFALAVGAAHPNEAARRRSLDALQQVCRTGTHLFMFLDFVTAWRGWGRTLRRAVSAWYTHREVEQLAYQLVKYRQRGGWTHRDVLRSAHPRSNDAAMKALLDWACGRKHIDEVAPPAVIEGYELAQLEGANATYVAQVVTDFNLPREALPTHMLKEPLVWEALLPRMPFTAMVRNLGNMTKLGLLDPGSANATRVCDKLRDAEAVKRSMIHPFNLLTAMITYASGQGLRGSGRWVPNVQIVDALDLAFYLAFGNVEPLPGRTLIALDTSGSMQWPELMGVPGLTPARAQAAFALITVATNAPAMVQVLGFDSSTAPLPISPRQRLDDVYRMTALGRGQGTDCSLPIKWAMGRPEPYETIIEFTDSQSWHGPQHTVEALALYRRQSNGCRFVVNSMVFNQHSVADPNDPLTLDVVGLDSSTPQLITEFARGKI